MTIARDCDLGWGAVLWRGAARALPNSRRRADPVDVLGALTGALALGIWAVSMMNEAAPASGASRSSPASGSSASSEILAIDGPEWQSGGYVGMPFTHPSDIRFAKPGTTELTVHDVNWDGKPFKSPIYYGLRTIKWGAGGFGGMIDFTHSKTISQPAQTVRLSGTRNGQPIAAPTARIGETFRHLEFSHGHNTVIANGMMRLGRLGPLLRPYTGAGLGLAFPHTEIQFADERTRTYEYQYAGPAGQVLAGIEIRLPRASVYVEYKFTLAHYSVPLTGNDSRGWGAGDIPGQVLRWVRGEQPAQGTATTILASHQVVGGLGIRSTIAPAAAP